MAREYLEDLRSLLRPATAGLPADVEIKHVFGVAAAYADGRIFISLTRAGLAMKLPEDARIQLTGVGATPLRYFPDGPVKKEYVVLPRDVCEDADRLKTWVRKSIDHVLTLPPPRPRKRRRNTLAGAT